MEIVLVHMDVIYNVKRAETLVKPDWKVGSHFYNLYPHAAADIDRYLVSTQWATTHNTRTVAMNEGASGRGSH